MPTPPSFKPLPLPLLRVQHRPAWRCLRTASAYPDFAHLARRLHLTHAELRALLHQLDLLLGDRQLWLEGRLIRLSDSLRRDVETLLREPDLPLSRQAPRVLHAAKQAALAYEFKT